MIDYKKIIKSRTLRIKILSLFCFVPDKIMLKLQYKIKMGEKLNLKNPKKFTEKIQWYKLYYKNNDMYKCANKYTVREYVKEKGLENILNKLYGVYDSVDEFEFDKLPEKFVMKDTLGGGSNSVIICKDKSTMDRDYLFNVAKKWLSVGVKKIDEGREWVYCNQPHQIIVEKYIESNSPYGLSDWKFFCFYGEVKFVYWLGNRKIGKSVECGIFDENFNLLPVSRTDELPLTHEIKKPDNYEEMKKIAEKLSKDFPFVRVDLYNEDNNIIFGELTFFPGSGYMKFVPESFDLEIGNSFILPKIKDKRNDI